MAEQHAGMINLERLELYDDLIKQEIQDHIDTMATNSTAGHVIVDNDLSASSTNPISSSAVLQGLSQKADLNHNHNDSYYTKQEVEQRILEASVSEQDMEAINTALSNKADLSAFNSHVNNQDVHVTAEDHAKLNGIEVGAQANKIEHIQKNGTELTITDKTVNITVPENISELTNDLGYITEANVETQIAGKADTVHTHEISDINTLEQRLQNTYNTSSTGTKNKVLATPDGADGLLSLRSIVVDDLPVGQAPDTVAPGIHTHQVSDILGMPTSMKTAHPLNLQVEGQFIGAYDGDEELTYNVTKELLGLGNIENIQDINRTVGKAMQLNTARMFSITGGGLSPQESFDGTADVALNLTSVNAKILMQDAGDTLILDGTI